MNTAVASIPRVLFVDDDPNVLEGLKRTLHPMSKVWALEFVTSADAAITLLRSNPVDIIVSDMKMAKMDGAALLRQVNAEYPDIVRMILSGLADQDSILTSVGTIHQFLEKPCDASTLKTALTRVIRLRKLIHDKNVRSIVTGIESLPPMPEAYRKLKIELARAVFICP